MDVSSSQKRVSVDGTEAQLAMLRDLCEAAIQAGDNSQVMASRDVGPPWAPSLEVRVRKIPDHPES